jgi:hypothetical protein
MPNERDEWIRGIKEVEREYRAVRFAVARTLEALKQEPTLLPGDLRPREFQRAAELLEGTYVLRLFAEFESGLRLFFQRARRRRPPSKTEDLLNSVSALRAIPPDQRTNAHQVREYRNALVHSRHPEVGPIPIKDARGHLCTFFSFLPRDW